MVRLQRSEDLLRWEDWIGVPATGQSQEVMDPAAAAPPRQFYWVKVEE
jgi:hypothetical protein